jgi:hypothetical protein
MSFFTNLRSACAGALRAEKETQNILKRIEERLDKIMVTLDDLIADAEDEKTVIGSVVTLLGQLSQQIKDAGTDPAKLQALKDTIDANKKAIADAIVANTPQAVAPTQ